MTNLIIFQCKIPLLWKIKIFKPNIHNSGNTGVRDFMCNNGFMQRNIDNYMTVRKDTASGKVGDDNSTGNKCGYKKEPAKLHDNGNCHERQAVRNR